MKLSGDLKRIWFKDLILPGDYAKIAASKHLLDNADSFKRIGMLHPVIVRSKANGYNVLAGRWRVAVCRALDEAGLDGFDPIVCRHVSCSDEEALMIEAAENAHRRHDAKLQAESDRAFIESYAKQSVSPPTTLVSGAPVPRRGSKKKPETVAREMLAAERGVSVQAIRQAEHRAKQLKPDYIPTRAKGLGDRLETWGIELDEVFRGDVREMQNCCESVVHSLELAIRRWGQAAKRPWKPGEQDVIAQRLQELKHLAKEAMPEALCPVCRGDGEKQDQCSTCFGQGYVNKRVLGDVPAEFKKQFDPSDDPFDSLV